MKPLLLAFLLVMPMLQQATGNDSGITASFRSPIFRGPSSVDLKSIVYLKGSNRSLIERFYQERINFNALSNGQTLDSKALMQLLTKTFDIDQSKLRWRGKENLRLILNNENFLLDKIKSYGTDYLTNWLFDRNHYNINVKPVGRISVPHSFDSKAKIVVLPIKQEALKKRMAVWVELKQGDIENKLVVWFSISVMEEVWVAARSIKKGQLFAKTKLKKKNMDIAGIRQPMYGGMKATIDASFSKDVRKGQIITENMLRAGHAINKHDIVELIYIGPAISIKAKATALAGGYIGDHIAVKVENGTEKIDARIMEKGVVKVVH